MKAFSSIPVVVLLGMTMVIGVGAINSELDPGIRSAFFYLIPVLYVTRHAGPRISLAFAAFATAVSLRVDLSAASSGSHDYLPWLNSLLRLGVLLVAVWLVLSLRRLNETLEARVLDRTARLEAEVKERLKLERSILDARESEQARIGQDLHDGLCQHLVATAFSAGMLQRSLEEKSAPEAGDACRITRSIEESIGQARDIAKGLHPVPLEEEGLETALRDLARSTSQHTPIRCTLEVTGKPPTIDKSAAIHLYRIAQEAINNAVKHSGALNLHVRLFSAGTGSELQIEDDGKGMSSASTSHGGMGLHIMDYRARAIGADLRIGPGKDGGTLVRCTSISPASTDEHADR